MKCKSLNQYGNDLVKIEQDKKPVVVATQKSDGTYSFGDVTPMGKRKSILDKKINQSAHVKKNRNLYGESLRSDLIFKKL